MTLTPEERYRIYQEEKARIESQKHAGRNDHGSKASPLEKLNPNIAGLLCYIGGWVSGIIFLVLEEKNEFVRFHAAQSIVVFGTLNLISMLFGWLPGTGGIITGVAAAFSVVFWVVLMVKAYQGELYRLPLAGEVAEVLARRTSPKRQAGTQDCIQPKPNNLPKDAGSGVVSTSYPSTRVARITSSAFIIALSIMLLVVFNYFNQYISYYNGATVHGVTVWTRYSFFTNDINRWLPILTFALSLNIIVHIILIIFDRYILREVSSMFLDAFGMGTVLSLLLIFPFDFSVIPDTTAADMTSVGVTMALISIAVGIGIGILVRLIRLVIRVASEKGTY